MEVAVGIGKREERRREDRVTPIEVRGVVQHEAWYAGGERVIPGREGDDGRRVVEEPVHADDARIAYPDGTPGSPEEVVVLLAFGGDDNAVAPGEEVPDALLHLGREARFRCNEEEHGVALPGEEGEVGDHGSPGLVDHVEEDGGPVPLDIIPAIICSCG